MPVKHMYGRFGTTSFAEKMMRANYDIHVGAIAGLPGTIPIPFSNKI
ncbi:MAG TPA: hypothetical protein VKB19_17120 [Pedobacter sp.]|nr:hypothetical protein [Pedobacter sp.]